MGRNLPSMILPRKVILMLPHKGPRVAWSLLHLSLSLSPPIVAVLFSLSSLLFNGIHLLKFFVWYHTGATRPSSWYLSLWCNSLLHKHEESRRDKWLERRLLFATVEYVMLIWYLYFYIFLFNKYTQWSWETTTYTEITFYCFFFFYFSIFYVIVYDL